MPDTPTDTAALVAAFHAAGYRTIRYKTGYKTIEWNRHNDPAHEPRAAFSSYNKTNPLTHKRWSHHENK